MNINVARKLHERRFRANPVMTTGELLTMIGSEGMQEAIEKRWIVPDQDTGFMMINTHGGKLQELESACRCACGKMDCACESKAEPTIPLTSYTMRTCETFTGFGLPKPPPTGGANMQTAPAIPRPPSTPTAHISAPPVQPHTNDPVKIQDEGREYEGEVSGFEQDGRIRLRWKGARPAHDRAYGPGEYLVVNKDNQPPHA